MLKAIAAAGVGSTAADVTGRGLDRRPANVSFFSPMNSAYLSAISALAGSAIGALASFATTWLTQHAQNRALLLGQMRNKRETLYGEFIDEAVRLFADAYLHQLDDFSKLVHIYGIVSKIRLFGSPDVIKQAEAVIVEIKATYDAPLASVKEARVYAESHSANPLQAFSDCCRADLGG